MNDFMFIFTGPNYDELKLGPEEAQAQMMKWFSWMDDLKVKGLYVEGHPCCRRPMAPSQKARSWQADT